MSNLVGRKFRTKVFDHEEDDDYGEVQHPIGSVFVVHEDLGYDDSFAVRWHGTALPGRFRDDLTFEITGGPVPAEGMWCIWTRTEILTEAEEIGTDAKLGIP